MNSDTATQSNTLDIVFNLVIVLYRLDLIEPSIFELARYWASKRGKHDQ